MSHLSNANENDIHDMKATVPSITINSAKKAEDDMIVVDIEYSPKTEPRKDIFNYAVEKSWVLTEMSITESNLEDIFRNLTGKKNEGSDE